MNFRKISTYDYAEASIAAYKTTKGTKEAKR
jgi:hypothetical protein